MPRVAELQAVGRSRKPKADRGQQEPGVRQINFRVSGRLGARLDLVSDRLGLDVSNFLRMVLLECLPTYEERAGKIDQSTRQEPG